MLKQENRVFKIKAGAQLSSLLATDKPILYYPWTAGL